MPEAVKIGQKNMVRKENSTQNKINTLRNQLVELQDDEEYKEEERYAVRWIP
eukprot:UN14657